VKFIEERVVEMDFKCPNGLVHRQPVKVKFVLGIQVPRWARLISIGIRKYQPWSFMQDLPWQVYKRHLWPFNCEGAKFALQYCRSFWSALGWYLLYSTGIVRAK